MIRQTGRVSTDPAPDYAAIATRVGCAPICDALDRRFGHRAHLHDLVAPPSGLVLSGRAVTMRFLPLRRDRVEVDRHDFGRLLAHARASILRSATARGVPNAG